MYIRKLIIIIVLFWLYPAITTVGQPGNPITDLKAFCSQQKGFNLLGKFDVSWSNSGFTEKEFSIIHDLGFNFVRLPLDYRTYTVAGNWNSFTESQLSNIDKAVEWGGKYGVHVCINLHRAPGYCVNSTTLPVNQQLNLWVDSVAQKAFVNHWSMFANRYKHISPEKLSFNLVNEPSDVTEEVYVSVMKMAVNAIHSITPNRVIFVDGLDYGRGLLLSLKDKPNIAQAIHCYDPFTLTHYKASWVNGSSDWPVPHWPMLWVSNYLYGPWKSDLKSPLIIKGNFATGTEVIVNVRQVSIESTLTVKAGTKQVINKKFVCSASAGTDFSKVVEAQWGYQNISNKDFSGILAEPTTTLTFENTSGDWMTINYIAIKNGNSIKAYYLSDNTWGRKQDSYKIDENGLLKTAEGNDLLPFNDYKTVVEAAKANNIPVMVQEFGVHNQTPHKVAVDFLTDIRAFFREHNLGWALWNLSGSFGILNSTRNDVVYEYYQGYYLDRKMLDALTKLGVTGVLHLQNNNSVNLFPVPAKSEIFFTAENFSGPAKFEIRNISGQIFKVYYTELSGNEITRLDISGIKPGMYLLTATSNSKIITKKFMVD